MSLYSGGEVDLSLPRWSSGMGRNVRHTGRGSMRYGVQGMRTPPRNDARRGAGVGWVGAPSRKEWRVWLHGGVHYGNMPLRVC